MMLQTPNVSATYLKDGTAVSLYVSPCTYLTFWKKVPLSNTNGSAFDVKGISESILMTFHDCLYGLCIISSLDVDIGFAANFYFKYFNRFSLLCASKVKPVNKIMDWIVKLRFSTLTLL